MPLPQYQKAYDAANQVIDAGIPEDAPMHSLTSELERQDKAVIALGEVYTALATQLGQLCYGDGLIDQATKAEERPDVPEAETSPVATRIRGYTNHIDEIAMRLRALELRLAL